MMCNRNIPTKLKDKVHKTAKKTAIVYGVEYWAARKKERGLHTPAMRMLLWARRKTRLAHVRNVDIWREEVEMVWTCAKVRYKKMRPQETYYRFIYYLLKHIYTG